MPNGTPLANFKPRKSGLFVPASPLTKKQRKMSRPKFLRLLRNRAKAREEGLTTLYLCDSCGKPLKLQRKNGGLLETGNNELPVDPKKDSFELACDCTVRTVA